MTLGRRQGFQQELVPTNALPRSPGHPFYGALNQLVHEAKFDRPFEELCEPLYGRPSILPGVFFRKQFIGCFEGIDSQRGIAWRCSDSWSRSARSSDCRQPPRVLTTPASPSAASGRHKVDRASLRVLDVVPFTRPFPVIHVHATTMCMRQ